MEFFRFRRVAATALVVAGAGGRRVWLEPVGREVAVGGFVEFLGEDDVAVELVDWIGPCIGTERVAVDAETVPALVLVLASRGQEGRDVMPRGRALADRGQERKDVLPRGRGVWLVLVLV